MTHEQLEIEVYQQLGECADSLTKEERMELTDAMIFLTRTWRRQGLSVEEIKQRFLAMFHGDHEAWMDE